MRRIPLRLGLVGIVISVVTACTGVPTTSVTSQETNVWVFVNGIMNRGPFLVEIRGMPFEEDKALFEERVLTDHTAAVTWSANPRFTTEPEEAASRNARTVLTFNAEGPARAQCSGSLEGGGPRAGGEVTIQATLCDGKTAMSNVLGSVTAPGGSSDPRFKELIQQITNALYSRRSERGRRRPGSMW